MKRLNTTQSKLLKATQDSKTLIVANDSFIRKAPQFKVLTSASDNYCIGNHISKTKDFH